MRPRRQDPDKPLRCPECHVGTERGFIGVCQECQVFWIARWLRPWKPKVYLCWCGHETRFTIRTLLHEAFFCKDDDEEGGDPLCR